MPQGSSTRSDAAAIDDCLDGIDFMVDDTENDVVTSSRPQRGVHFSTSTVDDDSAAAIDDCLGDINVIVNDTENIVNTDRPHVHFTPDGTIPTPAPIVQLSPKNDSSNDNDDDDNNNSCVSPPINDQSTVPIAAGPQPKRKKGSVTDMESIQQQYFEWSERKYKWVHRGILSYIFTVRVFTILYVIAILGFYTTLTLLTALNRTTLFLIMCATGTFLVAFLNITGVIAVLHPPITTTTIVKNKTLRSVIYGIEVLWRKINARYVFVIPFRIGVAHRISLYLMNKAQLVFMYTVVSLSISLLPVLLTSKNAFFRDRIGRLVDATIDVLAVTILPAVAYIDWIVFDTTRYRHPHSMEILSNLRIFALHDANDLVLFFMLLLIAHYTFYIVTKQLHNDHVRHLQRRNVYRDRHTRGLISTKGHQDRSMTFTDKFIHKPSKRNAVIQACYVAIGVIVAIVAAHSFNATSCPVECKNTLHPLFNPTGACRCLDWTIDCQELGLTADSGDLGRYIKEKVPADLFQLDIQNCPLMTDVPPELLSTQTKLMY